MPKSMSMYFNQFQGDNSNGKEIATEACSIECSAMAAVSLGLVFVSSCNEEAR